MKYSKWAKEYGKIFKLEVPLIGRFVVLSDPAYIQKHILGYGQNGLPKSANYKYVRKLFPGAEDNMFTSMKTSPRWQALRKGFMPAFSSQNLKKMQPVMNQKALEIVNVIRRRPSGFPIDFQALLVRFTLDVIGKVGFGVDFQALASEECPFLDALQFCVADSLQDILNPFRRLTKRFFPSGKLATECKHMYKELYAGYSWILSEAQSRGQPAEDDLSIWGCFSRIKDPKTGKLLDEPSLLNQIGECIIGGTDSTASQLAWTLFCIATHPDVQSRIVNELQGKGLLGKELDYAEVMDLKYLAAVIKESQRMFPAVVDVVREVDEDGAEIYGYRLPKGTKVTSSFYAMHYLPSLWDDPEAFNPDRWVKVPVGDDAHTAQTGIRRFWSFSGGAKDCAGQKMATLEMLTVLATLLSNFHFRLADHMLGWEHVVQRQFKSFVLKSDGGLWLHCDPRKL